MAERLPIYEIEQEIVAGVLANRRLIISAPAPALDAAVSISLHCGRHWLRAGEAGRWRQELRHERNT